MKHEIFLAKYNQRNIRFVCFVAFQSVTQHDFNAKKATVTPGISANNVYSENPRHLTPGRLLQARKPDKTKTLAAAAPPSDGKLMEALAYYKRQLAVSERSNEIKLPKISPRPLIDAAKRPTTQWTKLPEVDRVTSSSSTSSLASMERDGNKIGEVGSPPAALPPRSSTVFPDGSRPPHHRKY